MTLFDDVLHKAKNAAETAGKKTSEFFDLTRMKMQAADKEKEISSMLEGLGRLVYDSHKTGDDTAEAVTGCVEKLDALYVELAETRAKIDEFRNVSRCSECGMANTDDSQYCKQCGNRLAL